MSCDLSREEIEYSITKESFSCSFRNLCESSMLTCVACSKHLTGAGSIPEPPEDDDVNASTPSTKQAIKALTAQIKGMAVKASVAYKNCRPCSGSLRNKRSRDYMDSDAGSVSERFKCSYRRTGSSNSTPRLWNALLSGSSTPASVSSRTESFVFAEEDEPKEWVAQVEPGVLITFVSLPQAGNHLKRIRFSREIFNKLQAQRWWEENYDRVMELYNVQRLNCQTVPLPTPPISENENSEDSPTRPPFNKEHPPRHFQRTTRVGYSSESLVHHPTQSQHYSDISSAAKAETSSIDASARSSSSREIHRSEELSASNASDLETEWVEQDVPGVYITIRILTGGARELRRVRFSREKFGEVQARLWWEENRARIQKQYL